MRQPKTTALAFLLAQALGIAPAGAITVFVTGTVTEVSFVDRSPTPGYEDLLRDMSIGDAFEVVITTPTSPAISWASSAATRARTTGRR
jgi:hypothetical protein